MANRERREALRGVEEETLDLLSEVLTSKQWAELLKAPLERAAGKGNRGLAQKLVTAGAEMGQALHEAVLGGHRKTVDDLLEGGASTAAKDTLGNTPLHIAAREGKQEMVRLLMLKGADRDAWDGLERTPLYHAVCCGHLDIALDLMAAGVDVGIRFSPLESVVHVAARMGNVEMLKAVIKHGAGVNAANNHGGGNDIRRTALHCAAMQNDVETIDVLVDAGAYIEARNHGGCTPLHCAATDLRHAALVVLLKHGADVSAQARDRTTPLHRAVEKAGTQGAAEVVDSLLRSGADETFLNNHGQAAVDVVGIKVAEENNLTEDVERVRELLANAPADRAWRRRGYLVLCRAYPHRMQLTQDRNSAPAVVAQSANNRAKLAMAMVLGVQEEGIFRTIVGYL